MDELIGEIIAWQRKTFPDTTVRGTIRHLGEEVVEMLVACTGEVVHQHETSALVNLMKEKAKEELAKDEFEDIERNPEEEIADGFFMLIQLADLYKLNVRDCLQKKFDKNKSRQWQVDQDEIARHIPG